MSRSNRGGALLAVMWLSAALSAIAFSLANTVRGEIERSSTAVDGLRTQYLAQAGIERGILYVEWGRQERMPPNIPIHYSAATPVLPFSFPSGQAVVEVVPETAKMNVNSSPAADLIRLFMALGFDPDRATQIVMMIRMRRGEAGGDTSALYGSLAPSFQGPAASFQETEELMSVPGITPDLYYGGYNHDAEGHLVPRTGLKDCLSVFGATERFDVNFAPPPVLAALGIPPDSIPLIVARRQLQPFKNVQQLTDFAPGGGPAFGRLRVGGNSIFTFRSTARLLLQNGQFSDLRRTVAATVKFLPLEQNPTLQILRWYDNAWTP
jgi:general secretion pathway protein K